MQGCHLKFLAKKEAVNQKKVGTTALKREIIAFQSRREWFPTSSILGVKSIKVSLAAFTHVDPKSAKKDN